MSGDSLDGIGRELVVNPRQARELLTALTYVGGRDRGRRLVAMFACMYYATLRPAEAVNLRRSDCELPDTGWGRIYLSQTTHEVGKRYTDSGELHDSKGLKHRTSTYAQVWRATREIALTTDQVPPPVPTTCATRQSPSGSTSASPPPPSPAASATPSTYSSASTPTASTATMR